MDNFHGKSTKDNFFCENLLLTEINYKNYKIYFKLQQDIKLRGCLVFTRVFNFFGAKPYSTHALFHSCQPSSKTLG
jgi:hypothetical protein